MGCICSKGSSADDYAGDNRKKEQLNRASVQVTAPSRREEITREASNKPRYDVSVHSRSNKSGVEATVEKVDESAGKTIIIDRPKGGHRHKRSTTIDFTNDEGTLSRVLSMPCGLRGEQAAAGWPSWLTSVAGEAIQGWVPRSADSYEKINKIGQGTYSSVYKARDLTSHKIVAMKKVRFVNMDPESVRFMAREICIMRRLDHPNIMKLEALVTSKISGSLYLVFEYMEHDLAGLLASPLVKFTEPQIKCYMQQLFNGLKHCHGRGVLHRDIKGSNLLVDNNGVLKIGDFGLANYFQPNQKEPLTSRVVTLWYRAPELLLGATEYGVAIDMWSAGCILAELFAGKPIMPGRTEVEQMHKIFKLCGSPSEEYWRKSKLPHATSFKPQHPYKRCVSEKFKDFPCSALDLINVLLSIEPEDRGVATSALNSEFFTTKPLPCDASSLPKYPPSKEFDAKLRDEEAKRRKAESVKARGGESVKISSRQPKGAPTPDYDAHRQRGQSKGTSVAYNPARKGGSRRVYSNNGLSHSNSVIHPNAIGYALSKRKDDGGQSVPTRQFGSSRHGGASMNRGSHKSQVGVNSASVHHYRDERGSRPETMVFVTKRNGILCSGPLVPPGGNMDDMLKEHERHIQDAVRRAKTKRNG